MTAIGYSLMYAFTQNKRIHGQRSTRVNNCITAGSGEDEDISDFDVNEYRNNTRGLNGSGDYDALLRYWEEGRSISQVNRRSGTNVVGVWDQQDAGHLRMNKGNPFETHRGRLGTDSLSKSEKNRDNSMYSAYHSRSGSVNSNVSSNDY